MPCPVHKRKYVLFVLFFAASSTNGLRFKMHPRMFHASNRNITMSCSIAQTDDGPAITLLNKIQIKKMSVPGTWVDMAILKHDGSLDSSPGLAIATGYMGNVQKAYLNITWPWTSLQIMGKYRCESFGFTKEEKAKNDSITIVVGGTAETFPLDIRPQGANGLDEGLKNLINSSFSSFWSSLDSRFENLRSQKCDAATKDKATESTLWPDGTFALPMADSGCPLNPPAWDKGFKQINTGNHNENRGPGFYSRPLHLQILKTKGGHVYQQFCSIQSSPARTTPWPEGSYCINYLHKSCPAGFHWSLFDPGQKNSKGAKMVSDKPEKYELYSSPGVAFCCRHDGDPHAPINFPVSKPFYLYRHQGTCQEVNDMEVTQDSLIVDIAINGKLNFSALFPSQDSAFKPDFSVSPVKMELCYYSKSRQEITPGLDGVANVTVFIRKEPQPQNHNPIYIDDQVDDQVVPVDLFGSGGNEWYLAFRGTPYIGQAVYDAYLHGSENVDAACKQIVQNLTCKSHYRSSLLDNWKNIDEVAFVIYKDGKIQRYAIFDGSGTTNVDWFSERKLKSSNWADLKDEIHNYFSMVGDKHKVERSFYINRNYGGCPNDKGWFVAIDARAAVCDWEVTANYPLFLYANDDSHENWSQGKIARADFIAIFLKYNECK